MPSPPAVAFSPARGDRQIEATFVISTCIARYKRYIPVRQVTGTRTARYRVVRSKIDCRRSISIVERYISVRHVSGTYQSARLPIREPPFTGRFGQKSIVGGRLRKEKGRRRGKEKKKRGRKNTSLARRPRSPVVVARRSPTRHRRPRFTRGTIAFSPSRGDGASPRAGR
ncbi:hypothetical protein GW17_00007655 [Ensete ventricosum]|nr:hypothetical protein GW17_00007655 [Ensete ventricosum]